MEKITYGMLGIKLGYKGWVEFISEGFLENIEDFGFDIFEKGQILRPFSGLASSKLNISSKKCNGIICAYRVFYLPIFRRIEGGGGGIHPPPVLTVLKKAWS